MSKYFTLPNWGWNLTKRLASPLIILSFLASGTAFSSNLTAAPQLASPAGITALVGAAKAPQFDGIKLYHDAFVQIRDLHIKLDSPEKIQQFTQEWEHKFDKTGDLNTAEGTDKAVLKMMQSLGQRFDYYFNDVQTQAEHDQIDSTLTGIGATMGLSKIQEIAKTLNKNATVDEIKKAIAISKDNALQVMEPMEGGPAEKVGLKKGDLIRKVDGKDLNGMQMEDAIQLIKGKAGSVVKLSIERKDAGGQAVFVDLSVTRGVVTIPDVKFRDLGNGVSYISLKDFMSKNAVKEMHDALTKAAGGKGLILDLRGNPGGSLPAVLVITSMMLEDGPVLVTRSREGNNIVESEISLNKNFVVNVAPSQNDPGKTSVDVGERPPLVIPNDMPVVVLVDEGSASASEILSGALQHNHRAVVVGKPTVGKGVGQTVVQLPYGRSMHVTNFEFIPGRTPNDWTGVIPNVIVERGDDAAVDKQLDKAQEVILPMIKAVDDTNATRSSQESKHHDEFEKELKARGN